FVVGDRRNTGIKPVLGNLQPISARIDRIASQLYALFARARRIISGGNIGDERKPKGQFAFNRGQVLMPGRLAKVTHPAPEIKLESADAHLHVVLVEL